MSLFFDCTFKIENEKVIEIAWSNADSKPILAMSTTFPRVSFYQEDGIQLTNLDIIKGKLASTIKWHPTAVTLAIGWEDGTLSLWNEEDKSIKEEKKHKANIIIIQFSIDGSRVVSGDTKGLVLVWRTQRGLSLVCQYQRDSEITHITFCSLSPEDDPIEKWNSVFFIATKNGTLCFADDIKNCTELWKVSGHVKTLLFYSKDSSVIIITTHLLFVQIKLVNNEKFTPTRKMKLSVAGEVDDIHSIWAGNGLLVTCSSENMLRLFNIEKDENYVLTLADPIFGGSLMGDKILCVDYNNKKRILACGTHGGYIVMWKCKSASS